MHYSRHLHALRRPRGCGGRFLNTRGSGSDKDDTATKKSTQGLISNHSYSSDSGTLNSSKGPTHSGSSEVTSIYSRGDLDHHFLINHLGLSVHSISSMIANERGGTVTVATVDNCCNLKVWYQWRWKLWDLVLTFCTRKHRFSPLATNGSNLVLQLAVIGSVATQVLAARQIILGST